jgi:Icc-related predicted phosphoesterase
MLRRLEVFGKGADLIVMSGDVTTSGEGGFLRRFLDKLEELPVPTFIVPGNNEGPELRTTGKVENIDGRVVTFGALRFGGLGGSLPTPFNTVNEYPEEELWLRLERLGRVDVLVSHSPPFGTSLDTSGYGGHLGSRAVMRYVKEVRPKLVLCGHVHTAKAVEIVAGCTCCNPGAASAGGFAIVKMNGDAEVELKSL